VPEAAEFAKIPPVMIKPITRQCSNRVPHYEKLHFERFLLSLFAIGEITLNVTVGNMYSIGRFSLHPVADLI